MSWAMAIGTTVSIAGGLIQGRKAKKQRQQAEEQARQKEAALKAFEASRQSPINPYSGAKNMASQVKDLSGNLSNPYANIGVATQAAEFQAEQTDMALAQTLDTLQATGASAGGATALANAAAKSKQTVSATLEKQEANNSKMEAQGEARLQQLQMNEGARVQSGKIAAQTRFVEQQAKGLQYQFGVQENRDNMTLDRLAGDLDQSRLDIANANASSDQAFSAALSGVGSSVAAGAKNGFKVQS